jgi:hypothetical protein
LARPSLYIDESLLLDDTVYVAGQRVSPGMYVEVESRKLVHLVREDRLPASCDGRVAAYVQRPLNWAGVSGDCSPS